jgi:deoxyadenosine/deoxycytidine kinase
VIYLENLRIGVCGNIGVGKSTLTKSLTEDPLDKILLSVFPKPNGEKVYCFPEKFDDTVLEEFYQDPISTAFFSQIEFFNGRLERQLRIEEARGIVLEDRTLQEDYHIFGKAQRILGHMTPGEFAAYQRTYNLMTEKIDEPDLVVYLRATVDTLMERIQTRGRPEEKSIPRKYLELLNHLYEEFIDKHVKCPILVIDANDDAPLDPYLNMVVNKIKDKIETLDLKITTPGISDWVSLPETKATIRSIAAEKVLEDYLQKNPSLIAVAANVGLGKSTFTEIAERSLNIQGLYEDPDQNPLLKDFLGNKRKYCYDLQMFFLDMRTKQRVRGKSGDKSYVKDRSFAEDLVFCDLFYQQGHLTKNQLDQINTEFRKALNNLPSADLIVHLRGPSELAWRRIQQRGREMEIEGGWSYEEIRELNRLYKNYTNDVRRHGLHNGELLEIDVSKIDLTNRIHMGYVFEQIYESLSGEKIDFDMILENDKK